MKLNKNIKIVSILLVLTLFFFFSNKLSVSAESAGMSANLDELVENGTIDSYLEVVDKLNVTSLKNVDRLKDFTNLNYLEIKNVRIDDASFLNFPTYKFNLIISNCVINYEKLDFSKYKDVSISKSFYLGGNLSKANNSSFINPEYELERNEKFDQQLNNIAKSIYKYNMSERDIVKEVTKYVVNNMEYNDYCPYEGFTENYLSGCGVCEHYAHFEANLLNRLGVYTIITYGYAANMSHAWNAVLLDGNWYFLDPTWIDDSSEPQAKNGIFTTRNYLVPVSAVGYFANTHTTEMDYTLLPTNYKGDKTLVNKWNEELKPTPTPSATPIPTSTPSATPTPKENKLDANLKVLSVAGKKINLIDNVYEYKVSVGSDIINANLIYAPVESTSTVEILGDEVLKEGKNIIYIKVKSATGTTTTYIITIEKANKILSKNSKISELTIDGVNINFDKETTVYKVKVNKDVKELKLNIKLEDENAVYKVIGNENIKNNDQVTIKVIAEDESTTLYSIYIDKSQDNDFIVIIGVLIAFLVFIGIAVFITKKDNKNNKKQENNNEELKKQEENPKVETKIEEPIETTSIEINNTSKEETIERKEIVIDMPELVKSSGDSNIESTNPEFEETNIDN